MVADCGCAWMEFGPGEISRIQLLGFVWLAACIRCVQDFLEGGNLHNVAYKILKNEENSSCQFMRTGGRSGEALTK